MTQDLACKKINKDENRENSCSIGNRLKKQSNKTGFCVNKIEHTIEGSENG